MIEFTLSRVVLCICCISLLAASVGILETSNDRDEGLMNDDLAEGIADLLDRFQASEADEMVLRGYELLPSESHVLIVKDHVVTVTDGGRQSKAATAYGGSVELDHVSEVVIRKSLSEGLGDMPDGVGEDVDLIDRVVDVRGRTGATVDAARDIERMSAMHP